MNHLKYSLWQKILSFNKLLMQGGILIIDYGSQYTQLFARRIREFNVYCEIHPYNKVNIKLIKSLKPNGLVLSGGPNSILDKGAPSIPKCINNISKPILGICYGLQLLSYKKGAEIKKSLSREYGYSKLKILQPSKILPNKWNNKSWQKDFFEHEEQDFKRFLEI